MNFPKELKYSKTHEWVRFQEDGMAYIGYPAAMAIIDREYSTIGTAVQVDVRGRLVEAEVVKLPFYKK